jgi:uncharacterized protein YbjQ (UPF0145 family)
MRVRLACVAGFALLTACTTNNTYVIPKAVPLPVPWTKSPAPPVASNFPKLPVYSGSTAPSRPYEIVGVLDFHTSETSEDKGFDQLRLKAGALGADAILSAEFEHGDEGEKSHLSGVAIRWKTEDPRPYVIIGSIDIPTPEDADDKGFETMRAEAREMGADEVVNVHFEHGKEGGVSHLTGIAVRYKAS